jgi:hypothetical protein
MASGDIYVQVTASQRGAGKSRSIIVLVPESVRQSAQEAGPLEEHAIAQKLAEPFAKYAFSHRTIFDDYKVSYAFYENEPDDLGGRSPQ